jgi:hypothetical protein
VGYGSAWEHVSGGAGHVVALQDLWHGAARWVSVGHHGGVVGCWCWRHVGRRCGGVLVVMLGQQAHQLRDMAATLGSCVVWQCGRRLHIEVTWQLQWGRAWWWQCGHNGAAHRGGVAEGGVARVLLAGKRPGPAEHLGQKRKRKEKRKKRSVSWQGHNGMHCCRGGRGRGRRKREGYDAGMGG